jgi:hypothetical protein
MKVSSPVGDFPFEVRAVTLEGRTLIVQGSMGAWPARVEVGPDDIPRLLRLIPTPVLVTLISLALVVVGRALRPARPSGR